MLVVNENNRSNLDEVKKAIKRRNSAMDNYIMFEGRKIPLTEEQVAALKNECKKESPFTQREKEETYYYIGSLGQVLTAKECDSVFDREYFDVGNYCADKKLTEQRALHEQLDRLLWRFSMKNGELERPWDDKTNHWAIGYNYLRKEYEPYLNIRVRGITTVYFPTQDSAWIAIKEVVKPFMKEHPNFVW